MFKDNQRYYWNGSRQVPSGTTVIGQLDKPFLRQWAANKAVDWLWEHSPVWPVDDDTVVKCLRTDYTDKARSAYQREGQLAAGYGTFIHSLCEQYLTSMTPLVIPEQYTIEVDKGDDIIVDTPMKLTKGFMEGFDYKTEKLKIEKHAKGFYEWVAEHKIKPIVMEHEVVTDTYGGRLDLVCEMDGVVTLVDFKTGKGYFPEHAYQLAGYRQAWNAEIKRLMGMAGGHEYDALEEKLVHRHGILLFNKATGKVTYKDYTEYQATRTVAECPRKSDGSLPTEKFTRNYKTDVRVFNDCVRLWWSRNRGMEI